MANILLVGDVPDWAFAQSIGSLQEFNTSDHVLTAGFLTENADDLGERLKDADLVVAFCLPIFRKLVKLGADPRRCLVGMRGMGWGSMPTEENIYDTSRTLGPLCGNQIIYNMWKGNHRHVFLTHEAANTRLWFPPPLRKPLDERLVVGWLGDSRRFQKGYHHIFLPFRERAEKERLAEFIVFDRAAGRVSFDKVRTELYHKIDLYVMTSVLEGNPYPLYEAMACGVPCVSTPIGVAPELITHREDGYLTRGLNATLFYERLERCWRDVSERKLIVNMKTAALKKIHKQWTWQKRIGEWIESFDASLRRIGQSYCS